MKSKAVWHASNLVAKGSPAIPAVWKSVVNGKTWDGSNTHRAFDCSKTLKGAIGRFHSFVKGTS